MRRKFGTGCMILGAVLVFAALSLFLWNRLEDEKAGEASGEILPELVRQIGQSDPEPYDPEMTEAEIGGEAYIGYVSIPSLDLRLPVMSSWSYPKLRTAPCRYSGSTKTGDLVIAAHNYSQHFGQIENLQPGDEVTFTDMDGRVTDYEVAEVDTLDPADVEEMTDSGYALTLFTCTYSGRSRVTVRCEAAAGS